MKLNEIIPSTESNPHDQSSVSTAQLKLSPIRKKFSPSSSSLLDDELDQTKQQFQSSNEEVNNKEDSDNSFNQKQEYISIYVMGSILFFKTNCIWLRRDPKPRASMSEQDTPKRVQKQQQDQHEDTPTNNHCVKQPQPKNKQHAKQQALKSSSNLIAKFIADCVNKKLKQANRMITNKQAASSSSSLSVKKSSEKKSN